jgi:hypothetical protein
MDATQLPRGVARAGIRHGPTSDQIGTVVGTPQCSHGEAVPDTKLIAAFTDAGHDLISGISTISTDRNDNSISW